MANKSIGTLYIDIIARTESLEKDVAKVKSQMAGLGSETAKVGSAAKSTYENFKLWNSFMGRGMTGITADMMALSMAIRLVSQEVKYVYDNIERIPGINPEAVQSVNEFKVNLREARNTIDNWIATGLGGILQAGTMIGTGLAEAIYGDQGALETKLDTIDKIKAASDLMYGEKVLAAQHKYNEMTKQAAAGAQTQAARVAELNAQVLLYQRRAEDAAKVGDSLTMFQNKTEAAQRAAEALRINSDMMRRLKAYRREEDVENERSNLSTMSQGGRIRELTALVGIYEKAVNIRSIQTMADGTVRQDQRPITAAESEKLLQDYPKLLAYSAQLRQELTNVRTPIQEMSGVFVQGIGEMSTSLRQLVTSADNDFNKLLKNLTDKILDTFFSLAIINPLMNAAFGNVKGMSVLPSLWSIPGLAAGGPGRGPTWVGENGPELLNLPSGSTVIPNHAAAQMSGRAPNLYQIDARGADPSVVDRLSVALIRLAGPGVVEQRALAATKDAEWRRNG